MPCYRLLQQHCLRRRLRLPCYLSDRRLNLQILDRPRMFRPFCWSELRNIGAVRWSSKRITILSMSLSHMTVSEPLRQRFDTSTIRNVQTRSSSSLERRSESDAIENRHSKPEKTVNRRQCTERTPGQVDTRWDCDLNLPTLQQLVTEIQVNGLTSQEDTYAVYFTGFDNNDVVIGLLKGSIAAW